MPSPSPSPSLSPDSVVGGGTDPVDLINSLVPLFVGIAWPLVVLIILLRFQPQIRGLIDVFGRKLDESDEGQLSVGSFANLSWKGRIERIEESLGSLEPARSVSEVDAVLNEHRIPSTLPVDLLTEAHSAVGSVLRRRGAQSPPGMERLLSPLAESLVFQNRIQEPVLEAVRVLDDLYSIAMVSKGDIDSQKVEEYVELSKRVIAHIPSD